MSSMHRNLVTLLPLYTFHHVDINSGESLLTNKSVSHTIEAFGAAKVCLIFTVNVDSQSVSRSIRYPFNMRVLVRLSNTWMPLYRIWKERMRLSRKWSEYLRSINLVCIFFRIYYTSNVDCFLYQLVHEGFTLVNEITSTEAKVNITMTDLFDMTTGIMLSANDAEMHFTFVHYLITSSF